MGAALDAFGVAAHTLQRNPLLVGAAATIGIGGTVLAASGQVPLMGAFVALAVGTMYFFIEPFLAGGYLGMVNEAVDGTADFGDFVEQGKENYADLLMARLAVTIPMYVYVFVVVVVGFFVFAIGGAAAGVGDGGSDPSAILGALGLVTGLVMLVALLLPLIPAFLIQTYPAAIVVGDAGPLESFRYSYKLVTSYVPSVVGYTAFAFLVGLFGYLPGVVSGGGQAVTETLLRGTTGATSATIAGGFAGVVLLVVSFFVVKTLTVYVLRTYYVAFVRSVTGTA